MFWLIVIVETENGLADHWAHTTVGNILIFKWPEQRARCMWSPPSDHCVVSAVGLFSTKGAAQRQELELMSMFNESFDTRERGQRSCGKLAVMLGGRLCNY